MATDTEITPRIHLLEKQDAFVFSEAKFTSFVAGLGSGKTYAGCVKAILKCRQGGCGMVVAPTFPMLRDVTQTTFFHLLAQGGWLAGRDYDFNKTEGVMDWAGSRILFRSADAPDRLRGVNLNWAYLDEAALMAEDVWKIILGRLRSGNRPQAWITTTPAGFNWVYQYWIEKGDKNYKLIHASTRENTYLPEEYLEDLESNYSGEFARQEIDGEFVAFEGLVYPEFSRNRHVYQPISLPDSWPRVRGIDYGYTNPFVCLWGALDPDGRLYIYHEHYQRKTLLRDHVAAINGRGENFQWTVSDHDAQDNAELRAEGIQTRNAQKDVIVGIQKVKARLKVQGDGHPRLYVSERCVNTIKEFSMYRWSESKAGKNEKEEPVKEFDHTQDVIRYLCMELDNRRAGKVSDVARALGL